MATWAIGDVQGCAEELQRLLDVLPLDLGRDEIWFVGDLVNRGPASLQALRTVRALGPRVRVVLGNHDIHLLARAAGVAEPKRRDTLDGVLAAPDRDEILDWLRTRPLVHRSGRFVMVHAGFPPGWTVAAAERRARRAEAALRGPSSKDYLAQYVRAGLRGDAADAVALTNVRVVGPDGAPDLSFKGPPGDAPRGSHPWFRAPGRMSRDSTIVFGHWAALGFHRGRGVIGLDSGCVWGGRLTAMRLEDGRTWTVPSSGSAPGGDS